MKLRQLAVALSVVTSVLATVGPSPALGACDPGRAAQDGIWFAGTIRTPGGVPRAIETKITVYSPHIEAGDVTSAWNMLNSGGTKWAQVGWDKALNGTRHDFVQWTDNSGHWFTENFSASPIGSTPNFETIYNPGASPAFLFERDNALLWQATALWQPATVQTNGEIHNKADQMPGAVSSQVFLDNTYYTMGNGWLEINSDPFSSDWNNFTSIKASAHFYSIWDRKCSS